MTYLFYIVVGIIATYLGVMCIKIKNIPNSISDTYYLGAGNWFTICMMLCGLMIAIILLDKTDSIFGFLSGAGLAFIGAAPKFKDGERLVHFSAATVMGVSSLILTLLYCSHWILCSWVFLPLWIKTPRKLFWAEITMIGILILDFITI